MQIAFILPSQDNEQWDQEENKSFEQGLNIGLVQSGI